jgi:hypothetical protein
MFGKESDEALVASVRPTRPLIAAQCSAHGPVH